MNRAFSFISELTQSGLDKKLDYKNKFRVQVVNGFTIISGILAVVLFFVSLYSELYQMMVLHCTAILALLIPFVLIRKTSRYELASNIFLLIIILYATLAAYVAFSNRRFTDTESSFILVGILVLLIKDRSQSLIFYFLVFGLAIASKFWKYELLDMAGSKELFLSCVNVSVVMIVSMILFYSFKRSNAHYEKGFKDINDRLKYQNKQLQEQSIQLASHSSQLEHTWNMIRGAVDSLPLFVALLDRDGNYLVANKVYEEAFQLPLDVIQGSHYKDVLPRDILHIHEELIEKGLKGEASKFEHDTDLPSGRKLYSYGEYTPLRNSQGDVVFLNVFVVDITPLKEKENELQELNEIKNRLFSVISHDIRGPLHNLIMMLDMVMRNKATIDEFKALIPQFYESAVSNYTLINNLLLWVKVQIKDQQPHITEVKIDKVIQSNIALLKPNATAKDIELVSSVDEQLVAMADRNMLDVVIRNLISNSIKFTGEQGKIEVSVEEENSHLKVSVKDNGVGMTPEQTQKLFTASVSSTKGTKSEKGTGLGLLLCKEYVELNGGKIQVKSEPEKGSIFYFSVPRVKLT